MPVLRGAADPLAVADDEIAQLALRVELVQKAVGVARPGNELELHVDAGLRREVFRQLDKGVGRIPRRPTQGQVFGIGGTADRKTGA